MKYRMSDTSSALSSGGCDVLWIFLGLIMLTFFILAIKKLATK
jgi:hypothetical protein